MKIKELHHASTCAFIAHTAKKSCCFNRQQLPATTIRTREPHGCHWQQRTTARKVSQAVHCQTLPFRLYQSLEEEDGRPSTFASKLSTRNNEEVLLTCSSPVTTVGVKEEKGTKKVPVTEMYTNTKLELEETFTTNSTATSSTGTSDNATTSIQSIFLLNLVAIIWGTQHSVIKMVVDDCDPASFSFARFALAFALASPFLPSFASISKLPKLLPFQQKQMDFFGSNGKENDDQNTLAWKWGIEMGTWMFLGYAFQAIGLEYTTAQRSGFLLYLNVKFVPFFARILFGKRISVPTWVSAFAALVGTALLSYDGTSMTWNLGDLWSVAAAAASAMFILRLESATAAVKDSAALNATSLWMVTVTSFLWCIGTGMRNSQMKVDQYYDMNNSKIRWDWMESASMACSSVVSNVAHTVTSHPLELIYLGGVTTALSNYIQTKAQRGISAERASIIYALDPVYGAFFASLLLGEGLSQYGYVGAGLITIAAATNAFLDLGSPEETESPSSTTTKQ